MKLNRESALFLIVLAIVSLMAYFRYGDRFESIPMPRGKRLEAAVVSEAPVVSLPGKDEAPYDRAGRDIFLPPRDWNPLPYLVLEVPPIPEIGAVGLIPAPGVESQHMSLFRRSPVIHSPAGASAVDGAEGGNVTGDTAEADSRFDGIDFGDGEAQSSAVVLDDAVTGKMYDWFRRARGAKIHGFILNDNKYALIDDPSMALIFQVVDVKTGKHMGPAEFQRGDLEGEGAFGVGFGLADNVVNRIALEKRQLVPGVGNVKTQVELARKMLGWVKEDPEFVLGEVEKLLRETLKYSAKETDAWELLLRVKELGYDTEGAFAVYEEAASNGVSSSILDTRLGILYSQLGMTEQAETILRRAIAINPNDHNAMIELGNLLVSEGRAEEAVAILDVAQQRADAVAGRLEARLALVRALIRSNNLKEATVRVEQIMRMGIEESDAKVLRGTLNLIAADYGSALGEYRTALEYEPTNRDAVYNVGVTLAMSAEDDATAPSQAMGRFDQASDLDPLMRFESVLAKGAIEEGLGNPDRAAEHYTEALDLDPDNHFALYRAGRIARRRGDLDSARKLLRESLERDGRLVDVLNELGYTEILADRPKDAELYLRESLRHESGNPDTHTLLGAALMRQNRIAAARDEFEVGLGAEDDPSAAALCGLAWCEYRDADVDQSLQRLAEARATTDQDSTEFVDYATRNQELIEDNRSKEQWIDRFDRRQIRNNWIITEAYGPLVTLSGEGGVQFKGMQRRTDPDEPTELTRNVQGAAFVSIMAELSVDATNRGSIGLRFVYEQISGKESRPKGEISVARFPDGSLRLYVRGDVNTITENWTVIDGVTIAPDKVFALEIERTNYEKGLFKIILDGRIVKSGIESQSLRRLKRVCRTGVFAFAGGNENVDANCSEVGIIRFR